MATDSEKLFKNLSIDDDLPLDGENINGKSTNLNLMVDLKEDFIDRNEEETLFDSVINNDLQKVDENATSHDPNEWIANEVTIPNAASIAKKGFTFSPFRSKVSDIFTESYELQKQESDMFKISVLESYSDGFNSTYEKNLIEDDVTDRPGYNFLTLLNIVGRCLGYEVKETSKTIFTENFPKQLLYNTNTTTFGKRMASYTHPSKTTARHMCARDILYQLVEDGYYEKYGIPGKNKEECIKFLNSVMPTLPKDSITNKRADRDRNPTVILNEFCQKRHFPLPAWEKNDVQLTEKNQPIHSGTLHVYIWQTQGKGTSIKRARNDAGEKMLKFVEEFEANNPLVDPYIFE